MKLLKKIFLLILILIVLYGMSIFLRPEIAQSIDSFFWIPWFSQSIYNGKKTIDTAITDLPTPEEFQSGATDIKNTITDGIQTTKNTIDSIRSGAQKVENTYNQARETYEDVKEGYNTAVEAFSGAKQKLDEVQEVIDSVGNLTNHSE